jgi:hypothetical protein
MALLCVVSAATSTLIISPVCFVSDKWVHLEAARNSQLHCGVAKQEFLFIEFLFFYETALLL